MPREVRRMWIRRASRGRLDVPWVVSLVEVPGAEGAAAWTVGAVAEDWELMAVAVCGDGVGCPLVCEASLAAVSAIVRYV